MVDEVGGRRRYWVLATALILLACALAAPAAASAAVFTVDSTADEVDETLGNEACLTAAGKCTLRAAIEESNSSAGEPDEIAFDVTLFDGQVTGTIVLGSELPAIVDRVRIFGRECPTAAGVNGPCVGVVGVGSEPAFVVDNVKNVEIKGLAVTGAETGISVNGSASFKARGDWLGVKLDGSAGGGNTTGILLGPESNAARIGGEGPEAGNVFVNSGSDGLDIHGASNAEVLGNYFGIEKDGTTEAANGEDDIEVTSVSGGEFEAIGNAIGTKVEPEFATTSECDGGCNLISGAGSSGIDLEGDGGLEAPAVATTITGNYVGLDANGNAAVPNVVAGVRVGQAAQTVIGGPRSGEANRINGGDFGVLAGPEAPDLVVRGNLIGVDTAGTGSLVSPGEGISVNSGELASPAVEAVIAGNEVRMEGGVAIGQQGSGAWIVGNQIAGAETGIRTSEFTERGNLIEGNSIEELQANGILVENDLNEIVGNEISDVLAGTGIKIEGALLPFGVRGNLIGGDTAADENVITGSGGDAIEISDLEATDNEVARNRGIANNGLFIDLVAASPTTEPKGPNRGIEPPQFTAASQMSAAGIGAEEGAKVRVFGKQRAETGEVDSFLGEALADSEGNWEVVYDGAIPAGTIVAATQTSKTGGTSELSTAAVPAEPGSGGGAGGGDSGTAVNASPIAIADTSPPQTKIVKASRSSQGGTARFKFSSGEPGSSFQCKLDSKPFRGCKSPKKYEGLKPGMHVFKVRAIDPAGNADPSPAKKKFRIQQ